MVQTTLIILTYNEIDGLKKLIATIPFGAVDEYFAVDYESSDGTVAFLKKHRIPVVHQKLPGRSEAFRIGRNVAKGSILVYFSPDGNEDPNDIPKLLAKIKAGSDLAIASRFLPTSRNEEDDQLLKFRAWANRLFTLAANILFRRTGQYVSDSINGYRAITTQAFDALHLDAQGFAIEYQMTIRAFKKRLRIAEIPTREGNRIGGKSTASSIPTGLRFLKYLIRELLMKNK